MKRSSSVEAHPWYARGIWFPQAGLPVLSVTASHAPKVRERKVVHDVLVERLPIAQAPVEAETLVTQDREMAGCGVAGAPA